MKSRIARTTLGILFVATVCMSMVSTTKAQGPACSLALAAGKYANSMDGVFAGSPFAAVELVTVSADGNFVSQQTESLNGAVHHVRLTGEITLDADCTGTASWKTEESGILVGFGTLDLVFDDDMREVRFVLTSITLNDPDKTPIPVTVKGEGRKVFPRSSNQQ